MTSTLWMLDAPVSAKFNPLKPAEKVRQLRIAAMRSRHEADAIMQMPLVGKRELAQVARLRERAHELDVKADRLLKDGTLTKNPMKSRT